jgi:hypothetical protein
MFPENEQTMFRKGGQTWNHCFLAMFPGVDLKTILKPMGSIPDI